MQETSLAIELIGKTVELNHDGSLYLPDKERLVICDLHLGKAAYFQRNGLPLSMKAEELTLLKLSAALTRKPVKELFILGDLFHVADDSAMETWATYLKGLKGIQVSLIMGNHERLPALFYENLGMLVERKIVEDHWEYIHDEADREQVFSVSGHEHPGIRVKGPGRQYLRLPCFRLSKTGLVLPSFGKLTGLYCKPKARNEQIFIVWPEGIKSM
jgi:uncharacterized protein